MMFRRLAVTFAAMACATIASLCSGCITTYSFGPGTRANPTSVDYLPQVSRLQIKNERVHVAGNEGSAKNGPVLEPKEIAKGERFRTVGVNGCCDYRFIESRGDQIIFDRHDSTGGCAAFLIFAFFHDTLDTIAVQPYDFGNSEPPPKTASAIPQIDSTMLQRDN